MKLQPKPEPMVRLVWRVGLTALWGALLLSLPSAPSASAQPAPNDRFGIDFVGVAGFVDAPTQPDRQQKATNVAAAWDRWVFYWDKIEAAPDQFEYADHDSHVAADLAAGLTIDGVLMITPGHYATAGSLGAPAPRVHEGPNAAQMYMRAGLAMPQQTGCEIPIGSGTLPPRNLNLPVFVDGPGGSAINRDNYWAYYVWRTVERYDGDGIDDAPVDPLTGVKPVVKYWEMWNEPDYPCIGHDGGFWNGTPAEYYRLLKVGYLAAKQADPETTVILGGLTHWAYPLRFGGTMWFDEFLNALAADPERQRQAANNDYFDVLAVHWYSRVRNTLITFTSTPDTGTWNYAERLRSNGLTDKTIWINESGVPAWADYPGNLNPATPFQASLDEQAAYVIQNMAYAFAAPLYAPQTPVERVFHFQLYDDGRREAYGLIRNPITGIDPHPTQPDVPRPAYDAYATAAEFLAHVEPIWHTESGDGLVRIAFFQPPDKRVMVLWSWDTETRAWSVVRTGSEGLLVDQTGTSQTLQPSNGTYSIELAGATNFNQPNNPLPMIGGRPNILVEQDTVLPSAQLTPLPSISGPEFEVAWDLQDWGTGIAAYQVLYSDGPPVGDGDWTLWVDAPAVTPVRGRAMGSRTFDGATGHTYYFTVRAQDRAGNWSAPGASQTYTTIAEGGTVSGRVFSNRETPVESAEVEVVLDSAVVGTATTAADGTFQVEDVPPAAPGESYGVRAQAAGYGQWPTLWRTMPEATTTLSVDLDLPPYRNQVVNGGFEAGGLAGWTAGGQTAPRRSTFVSRTGDGSALLGFTTAETAPGDSVLSQTVDVATEAPALGFWFRVYRSAGSGGVATNTFDVVLTPTGGGEPQVLNQWGLSTSEDWQYAAFDLADFAGQSVELAFRLAQPSADLVTVVYLDHVALGQSTPAEVEYSYLRLPLVLR